MSYDFSFLGKDWYDLINIIKESEILLKYDSSKAVYASKLGCEQVISKIIHMEKLSNKNSLENNIQQLKDKNIIDGSINIKFKDIYHEYEELRISRNTEIGIHTAERCIANIYDILKWYANKYDENLNKYDLDFLNDYSYIKAELTDARNILFNDTINLQHGYNDAVRKCRVVIEGIVREIQIRSNIEKQNDLYNNIKSIEPVMGSGAIPILQKIRRNGNVAIHINDRGMVNIVKKEDSIIVFKDTYNLARVFAIYMEMQNLSKPSSKNNNKKPNTKIKTKINTNTNTDKIKTNKNVHTNHKEKLTKHNGNRKTKVKYLAENNNLVKPSDIEKTTAYKTTNISHEENIPKNNNTNYSGEWTDDYYYKDKKGYYTGEVKNGSRHGKGTMKYHNGETYEGEWSYNSYDGKGTLTYKDGTTYTGDFIYAAQNDRYFEGVVCFPNGEKYEGRCVHNRKAKRYLRFGKGTMYYNNGSVYSGSWQMDSKNGPFIIKSSIDGKIYNAQYIKGEKVQSHSVTNNNKSSQGSILKKLCNFFK